VGAKRSYASGESKALFVLSRGHCYFPDCPKPVLVKGSRGKYRVAVEIAHIRALEDDGPRADTALAIRERNRFWNLLLMCGKHHDEIDDSDNLRAGRVQRLEEPVEQLLQLGVEIGEGDLDLRPLSPDPLGPEPLAAGRARPGRRRRGRADGHVGDLLAQVAHPGSLDVRRHSYATWLVSSGVPVNDVQKVMGHEQASTTLNSYTHASSDSERRVRNAFADYPLTASSEGIGTGVIRPPDNMR
jgi:hypothetical protein